MEGRTSKQRLNAPSGREHREVNPAREFRCFLHRLGHCVCGLWLLFVMPAAACQVPVFRYALERWPADPYRLLIVADPASELSAEQQAAVATAVSLDHANLVVRHVLPDEVEWPAEAEPGVLPLLALQYPAAMLRDEIIWSAPLNRNQLERLLDSPARRALATRALAGETAVWVLLESGDAAADRRTFDELRRHLDTAESELVLPEGVIGKGHELPEGGDPENELQSEIPLQLKFSTVRIGLDDPDESAFRAMLLRSEPGLDQQGRGPLVFAMFGQGRTLPALFAADLSEESVVFGCNYLCGACSCQVKRENPGFDLLLNCDWHAALAGIGSAIPEKILPPLSGVILPATAERGLASEDADSSVGAGSRNIKARPFLWLFVVLGLVLLGVGVATVRVLRRS